MANNNMRDITKGNINLKIRTMVQIVDRTNETITLVRTMVNSNSITSHQVITKENNLTTKVNNLTTIKVSSHTTKANSHMVINKQDKQVEWEDHHKECHQERD